MRKNQTYDIVIRKAYEMQNQSFEGEFPDQAKLWKEILSSGTADQLPVGVALMDRNFVLLNSNELYKNYIETYSYYTEKEAMGMEFFDVFTSDRSFFIDVLKSVRDDIRQFTDSERQLSLSIRDMSGFSYWDAKVIPIKDDFKEVVGIILFTVDVTRRVEINRLLSEQRDEISELKSALRTVMKLRQEDQVLLEQKIAANIKHIIDPFISNLRKHNLTPDLANNIDGIEFGINNFVSEFSSLCKNEKYSLTPKEIQVAAMIKMGRTTKDIAESFHISPSSIDFHRKNIRSKLDLKNKKINLQSYLISF